MGVVGRRRGIRRVGATAHLLAAAARGEVKAYAGLKTLGVVRRLDACRRHRERH